MEMMMGTSVEMIMRPWDPSVGYLSVNSKQIFMMRTL
jgi:hypothetical protein